MRTAEYAVEAPLTVADCDQQLRRLAIRLENQQLAEYEVALLREDIDEWLERRLLCALAALPTI